MAIRFKTKLSIINDWTILKLPKSASTKLPSRGVAMIEGTINGQSFQTALEPDGLGSHWFRIDSDMRKVIGSGDTVTLAINPAKEWVEPDVPADFKKALAQNSQANSLWNGITPINRWDWTRWLRSTKNPETRKKRIETAMSMLKAGKGRRCCFNRSECTVPDVSNRGILLESTE
ncbi:MAG: YdeI/OmpD-associated family protein [Nanoarchaeota archaeon]